MTTTPDTSHVYLVRHAKAGSRDNWEGDDTLRPLSNAGRRQAELLADRFAAIPTTRLLSSPYVRCVETLQPTAARLGGEVEEIGELTEGEPWEPALDLIGRVAAGTVLCSHGDLIPALIAALERRGAEVRTPPDWRKATVWTLERNGDRVVAMSVAAPPA